MEDFNSQCDSCDTSGCKHFGRNFLPMVCPREDCTFDTCQIPGCDTRIPLNHRFGLCEEHAYHAACACCDKFVELHTLTKVDGERVCYRCKQITRMVSEQDICSGCYEGMDNRSESLCDTCEYYQSQNLCVLCGESAPSARSLHCVDCLSKREQLAYCRGCTQVLVPRAGETEYCDTCDPLVVEGKCVMCKESSPATSVDGWCHECSTIYERLTKP